MGKNNKNQYNRTKITSNTYVYYSDIYYKYYYYKEVNIYDHIIHYSMYNK